MSVLKIYNTAGSTLLETVDIWDDIAQRLNSLGLRFERWKADQTLNDNCTQEEVLNAYKNDVERLNQEYGFQSVDVVSLTSNHPDKETLRGKFLNEHTHDDNEVRFFVDGFGLFYIHLEDKVFSLLCEKGDLINVPANIKHWFDMGANPHFKCIRFFTRPDGCVGNFTGDKISEQFPYLEN
jgi:1,2-dihydroxy-3-keto-5-methylthiopentene dioxygenase